MGEKAEKRAQEQKMRRLELEGRVLRVLSRHHGEARAISMVGLWSEVFGARMGDKINGTRPLRGILTRLRREGLPICSVSTQDGGGYYLASAGSDLEGYCRRLRNQALRKLLIESKLRNLALPELLGQISINLAREATDGD